MGAEELRTWLTIAQIVMSAIVALVLYAFATGRWSQKREVKTQATGTGILDLRDATSKEIRDLTVALAENADCDRVTALEERTEAEHTRVSELSEKTHDIVTTLALEQRGQQERLKVVEETVKELRLTAFNSGVAGV